MRLTKSIIGLLHHRRPVLRVQLALLYSGVFVGLVVMLLLASSVLFGTANVFFGHSEMAARPGVAASIHNGGGTRQFMLGPFLIALLAVAIALVLAWWLAGRFLRPLRAMTTAAQEISATNLHRRLNLDGPDDELTELGRTLDDLFGRLQASFESQRQFVANASHELRTPLAGQRTVLQVALADPDADAQTLRSTCEEALRLGGQQEQLVDALLTLATSERGVERWEQLDLRDLAQTVIDGRMQQALRDAVRIETALANAPVTGDASLVESLIANLVDNAIRHNVDGGRIEIATTSTAEGARLSIRNTGPAVPARELERLFQPFQRLGEPRIKIGNRHGLGLGLAVVQAIATAHGATLTARPRPEGGLDVEVAFSASRKAPPPLTHPVKGTG